MPIANLQNAKLHYKLEGPDRAPVIVLSNSLGTDLEMWNGQVPELSKYLRVLRYDTRGHGSSKADGDAWSLAHLGLDVLELLNYLGIDRFHVCGISLGGMTALWLAIHAPQRVLSLMPCNTAARIGNEATWNARIKQVQEHGLASIADATMERWFTASFRDRASAQVEATRQMLLRTDASAYLACCAALRDADLTGAISSISAPTLVISATSDPVTPPSDGRLLQERIPGAVYREINAAHLSNIEDPASFLAATLQFVTGKQ